MKKIFIITLFPEFFHTFLQIGVVGQALRGERKTEPSLSLHTIQLRDFSHDKYKSVDDAPFGGGPGMVMRADILEEALLSLAPQTTRSEFKNQFHIIYTSPRGTVWNHQVARTWAKEKVVESHKDLVFICGRYEGIDERFIERYVDECYSMGDFVLSGGEIAVMAVLDSALRFVPGILGNQDSSLDESFEHDFLLESPRYTRPQNFNGIEVPNVLLSGHHQNIKMFEMKTREEITKELRPDLWQRHQSRREGK